MRTLRRLAASLVTLWAAATLVFFLIRLIPGDPATAIAGEHADAEAVARIRARWSLDRPLHVQYGAFLANLARGDLGESIGSGRPVAREIADRFGATAELAGAAMLLAAAFGIPLGILAGSRRGGAVDAAVSGVSLLGVSVPIFVTGYVLILLKVQGGISFLEFAGRKSEISGTVFRTPFFALESLATLDGTRLAEALAHLAIPAATLATVPLAMLARITRAGMRETLGMPFILAARARGIPPARLLFVHALKNAATALWTAAGLQAGYLLGGAVLTETVFAWPGLGSLFYEAVISRDYPVVQGLVIAACGVFLAVNALVDALYPKLDPRVSG